MDAKHKNILIIYYDPDFAELMLELLRKSEVVITLETNLVEGEDTFKKGTFGLVVIECPVILEIETLSRFISQNNLTETQVFLVAKEKKFLTGLDNRDNVLIFDQDNIRTHISSFIENIQ